MAQARQFHDIQDAQAELHAAGGRDMSPQGMSPLIFQVVEHDGAWSVEHQGNYSNRSKDKADAVAAATKLARAAIGANRPSQVRIAGETGYF